MGPSDTGWDIIRFIIQNVITLIIFIIYLNKQMVKQAEQIKGIMDWMKAHDTKDDDRFKEGKDGLEKESGRFEKKLDDHIRDRKEESRSINVKLDNISNSMADMRVKFAETIGSKRE